MCKLNKEVSAGGILDKKVLKDDGEVATGAKKFITNEELRSHNSPQDAWCSVHGRVVAISEFSKRHPGGDLILLAAGKDATVLFETYHPRGVSTALLEKLQVGKMKEGEIHSSFYSWDSEFYKTLRTRVVQRLDERGLTTRGSLEITIKALMIVSSYWFCIYNMCTTTDNFLVACLWSIAMGISAGCIGVCIQHDGNHGAFSKRRSINKIAGWTLDMIGASAFTWEFQHMLGHHPYTNLLDEEEDTKREKGVDCDIKNKDQESDPDVFSSFPAMRMHPSHEPQWYHSYQHVYAPILFALMTLSKVLHQDVSIAINHKLYQIDAECRYGSILNVIRFWSMKVITMGYMLVLPSYCQGSLLKGFGLFLVGHFACGEFLATMFIVNHVIEGISYAKKNTDGGKEGSIKPATVHGNTPMEATQAALLKNNNAASEVKKVPYNDWAAVQCQTSVNWSPGSWFWNHFSGGLSHQIEHHLFPSICHTNYVHIQDVVQSTCEEYGVPYQSESNLGIAYVKMLRHLKFLGRSKAI